MKSPLELTVAGRDVSVTERGSFRGCRRRWYLETIGNLEPKATPRWATEFGTGIHAALEAYYLAQAGMLTHEAGVDWTPREWAQDAFSFWVNEKSKEISAAGYGDLEGDVQRELQEYAELGSGMLDNYDLWAEGRDQFEVLAVEGLWTPRGQELVVADPPYPHAPAILHESGRLLVPIVNPETEEVLTREAEPVYLSGKLDLIVAGTGSKQGEWVVDHKTSATSPSDRGWDFDDQATGYCYIYWRYTGRLPRGVMPNYLVKNLPADPRILQNGTLSTAKDQATLPTLYRDALIERGLMVKGRISSAKHSECYSALLSKGWDPFFRRFEVQRNAYEVKDFEERLWLEIADMHAVVDKPRLAYPNPDNWRCPSCAVAPICQAMMDGSDVADIIEHRFQEAPDRKAEAY